jgi:hypothetical protein
MPETVGSHFVQSANPLAGFSRFCQVAKSAICVQSLRSQQFALFPYLFRGNGLASIDEAAWRGCPHRRPTTPVIAIT